MRAPNHSDESARLEALGAYGLEEAFDSSLQELVAYASEVCETPVSLVSVVEAGRQRFLADVGFGRSETTREDSFCAHAILQSGVFEVADATKDPRFADNALVVGDPGVRFYAGVPIAMADGLPAGALCVLDTKPRELTAFQRRTLAMLARQAEARLEIRRRARELEAVRSAVEKTRQEDARALNEERARQDRTLQTAGVAVFDWEVPADRMRGNDLLALFYGVPNTPAGNPIARYFESIHPDDRAAIRATISAALDAGSRYETHYRLSGADGKERWARTRGEATLDAEGRPQRLSGIVLDVTEQMLAERTLAALNEELEARVAARTGEFQAAVAEAERFNYSISHDLRTPLRAIASTSSILLEDLGPRLDEESREHLLRQTHNAVRMGALIDALLQLSRLSRVELKIETLDVTRMARDVFDVLKEHGETNGCTIEIQDGMVAEGDPGLVRTLLRNLLGNACKFSPNGGTIRVGQEDALFSVSDEGVGFDMAHAGRMFLPFERLVSDEQFRGTGIGLANVDRIVKRHGGRVTMTSAPGTGATFSFTLGLSAPGSA